MEMNFVTRATRILITKRLRLGSRAEVILLNEKRGFDPIRPRGGCDPHESAQWQTAQVSAEVPRVKSAALPFHYGKPDLLNNS